MAQVAMIGLPCEDAPTVTDHQGYVYRTVQLGPQCWMAENMRCTTSPTGKAWVHNPVFSVDNPVFKSYYITVRNSQYGNLYNWSAAMDLNINEYAFYVSNERRRGICPKGWHLPSDAEWTQLTDFVSSQRPYACGNNTENNAKALAATTGWKRCKKSCTAGYQPEENNASGFAVLPAGGFYDDGYGYFGKGTFFWTSTEYNNESAYKRYLDYDTTCLVRYTYLKIGGGAVRCVQN